MYYLQVFTPEEVVFDDYVIALIAPGASGYLGILTDHAPLMTTLKPGTLIITDKTNTKLFYHVSEGFLEVKDNKASILIDTIQPTQAIKMSGGGI